MTVFLTILLKLLPLYLMIALGYLAAKGLNAQKETVAKLLIYIIAPAVLFYGAFTTELSAGSLSLPILFFAVASLIGLSFHAIGTVVYKKESTKSLLAFAAGTGNTGYFGLPVIYAVLGEQAFGLATLAILGFVMYENTIGFYLMAKGRYSARDSLKKVVKLPLLYAISIGIVLNLLSVNLGEIAINTIGIFKGAYTLLGMMIIGMGLASVKIRQLDFKFLSLTFMAKFIIWPLVIAVVILLDQTVFFLFGPTIYPVMIIMAIVPLAANTVAFATELNVHPDKAAFAVLLSTIFALFYIPLATTLFIR